jgi:hypothetical protein
MLATEPFALRIKLLIKREDNANQKLKMTVKLVNGLLDRTNK